MGIKKWITALTAVILTCGLLLSGCGAGGKNSDTISFFGRGGEEELRIMQRIITNFVAETGIEVDYDVAPPDTYMTTLQNKSKRMPDVFYMPDEDFIPYADAGKLLNLDGYVAASKNVSFDDLYTEAVNAYRYDAATKTYGSGNLFAMPKDLGPYGMVLNKSLFRQAVDGMDETAKLKYKSGGEYLYPSQSMAMKWSEFRGLVKDLTHVEGGQKYFGLSNFEITTAVYSNNADFLSDDGKTFLQSESAFSDALQFIVDMSILDKSAPDYREQAARNGYTRFINGEAAISWMGPWDAAYFWANLDFEWDLIPVPYGPGSDRAYGTPDDGVSTAYLGSMGLCISSKSKKADNAYRLIEYITTDKEAQKIAYTSGQAVPNLKSLKQDYIDGVGLTQEQSYPENRAEFIRIVETNGKRRPKSFTYSDSWYDDYLFGASSGMDQMWAGKISAAAAVSGLKSGVQGALDLSLKQWGK